MNRSKLSMADNIVKQMFVDPSGNNALYQQSGGETTNLKLVEKELQFKLLDMSMQIENDKNSDEEDSNTISGLNNKDKPDKYWHKNVKNELESYKKELSIKDARRKSVNVNEINQIYNLNSSYDFGKTIKRGNKTIVKGLNKSIVHKMGTNNNLNTSGFQNDFSKTNINMNMNKGRRSGLNKYTTYGINWANNSMSFNKGNKSMYINLKKNMSINRNVNFNNKTVFVNKNNISMNKFISIAEKNKEYENKYRIIKRNKELYDSFEDEEVIEELEEEYIFISPETRRIFIFDTCLLLSILFSSFYYPLYIAQSICFCYYIPLGVRIILFLSDILNIFDILISFFRAYYNFEFILVKRNDLIVKHYLKKTFFIDLIAAIPIFSISDHLCTKYNPDGNICFINGIDLKYNILKGCLGLKILKIFKVLRKKYNRGINYFFEKISENYTVEKAMKMILFGTVVILGFNIFICFHIYIGRQTYPNWIIETNNQDRSFLSLYLISLYFLITTITSVGYGDITCVSLGETIFQIILLTIGVVAYSWVISTIGNYVKKETRAAIKYNKDIGLLEEIRISYPKMSFKLYNKIHKHLETVSHQQERFDTNLLVNNLPYTLKNKLMFIIYEKIIKKFIFFKECQNSDFILRVLTSYIPMSAKKGAFVIQEGELVDYIVFVKEGRLSLVAAIDLEDPISSIDKYLEENFEDINEKMDTKLDNSMLNQSMNNIGLKIQKAQTEIKSILKTHNELNETNMELEIGKRNFEGDEFDVGNHQFLNILDILKNEHYGEVYMFLQKPSPLSLRVKSKYSELFLLRKHEAMVISKAYPNVWKKIYHKSYHNMKSIKKLTQQIIVHYCNNHGHKYESEKPQVIRSNSDFLVNLGILNSKSRKRTSNRKIKFDLEGNASNKNINVNKEIVQEYPKKSILKKRVENIKSVDNKPNISIENNPFQSDSNSFLVNFNRKNMNKLNTMKTLNYLNQLNKMKTMGGNFRNNNFRVSSKNKFPNTIFDFKKTLLKKQLSKMNRMNNELLFNNKFSSNNLNYKKKFSNKINITNKINNNTININTININNINNNNNEDNKTVDLNCISKILSNFEDNSDKATMNNNRLLTKMNSNVPIRFNSSYYKNKDFKTDSNTISALSFKGKNSNTMSNFHNPIDLRKTEQIINDGNLNDTKILQNSSETSITHKVKDSEESVVDKTPNTLKNLSRPLLKKIQKKIKKRQKKKKLYKMLLSKISESLIRINPNINLTNILNSSINNSLNNSFRRNDYNNYQLAYNVQNSDAQENSTVSDKIEMNEGLPLPLGGQELLVIPESPEFDSETSSSENTKSSNESNSVLEKEKTKVELTISENYNFSYNKIYDNLDIISDGNYSKDINLQKSVTKLIGVYLKEKMKSKLKTNIKNDSSEVISNKKDKEKEKDEKEKVKGSIIKKKTTKKDRNNSPLQNREKKEKEKEEKEKEKEEDVWAFLNEEEEHDEHEGISFKLGSSSSKSSNNSSFFQGKNYSKTPKGKFKKNIDFTTEAKEAKVKSRFKKNNSNIYAEKEILHAQSISPKNRKKKDMTKRKSKKYADIIKMKKCTTIINPKKMKNKMKNEKNKEYKSNKEVKYDNKILKKDTNVKINKENDKDDDTILNSLDLSLDNIEEDTFVKNNYKTFHKKKKDDDIEEKLSSKFD